MDPRLALLKDFSRTFVPGTVKIEAELFGFDFLDALLSGGVRLDYGELTNTRLLHKYRLSGVSDGLMDSLLQAHLDKRCNVCRYFGPAESDVLCFNLDNNHRVDNTAVIPEVELAVRALRETLADLDCPPLILASGRGFHAWCRFDRPIANPRLYAFMLHCGVRSAAAVHGAGLDHKQVKFNFYPDIRVHGAVSLRLFGSVHAKNRVFSRVLAPEGLLDEPSSWSAFEDHLRRRTISEPVFAAACDRLGAGC